MFNILMRSNLTWKLFRKRFIFGSKSSITNSASTRASQPNPDSNDEPIKFSNSEAAKWSSEQTRTGQMKRRPPPPWYQLHVVTASLAIFLVYFGILREENDIDEKFNKTIYDHIEGLEEENIKIAIKYNESKGLPTMDLKKRLEELQSAN